MYSWSTLECGFVTKYSKRVIGSTDVYPRKHIDRQVDRLERLHGYNKTKIADLKARIAALEKLVQLRVEHILSQSRGK